MRWRDDVIVSKPSLPELILGTIAETLAAHWPAVGRAIRIGVVLPDENFAATMAPGEGPGLEPGAGEGVDLLFVTNARTLEDLIRGKFDPTAPKPEHLMLYGGDFDALGLIARALAPSGSWLDLRAAQSAKKGARK